MKNLVRKLITALAINAFIISIMHTCYADQAEWIPKEYGSRALDLIQSNSEIRLYCAPCGDKGYQSVRVKRKKIKLVHATINERLYQIVINNSVELDLAYTYINQKGQWINLAILVGLKPEQVPEYLTKEKHLQIVLNRSSRQRKQEKTPDEAGTDSGTVPNAHNDADFDKMLNITLSFLIGNGNDTRASKPSAVRDLVGTIGKNEIEMHLIETDIMRAEGKETYYIGTQYSGYYFYKKDGKHIPIHGIYDINGMLSAVPNPVIDIYTEGNNTVFTGHFYGHGSRTRYRGTFRIYEPYRNQPFRLMPKQNKEQAVK